MALPNTNISVAMVKSELGAATNDVGRLCIHPNVNKWSKWKPVKHSSVTPITEVALKGVNYGFIIPSAISQNETSLSSQWIYEKPAGGENSPFRLSDFKGYNKSSIIPFDIFIPPIVSTEEEKTFVIYSRKSITDGNIDAVDFFGNMYFGVMIKKGTLVEYKTDNVTMAAGVSSVDIKECVLTQQTGAIEIYCFYTQEQIPEFTSIAQQVLYSLNGEPDIAYKNVVIEAPSDPVYLIEFDGFNASDKDILMLNGVISVNENTISQPCVLNKIPNTNYILTGVRVTVVRNSDKLAVYNQFFTDTTASPQIINTDGIAGEAIELKCKTQVMASQFPELLPPDYYRITHTLVYEES